MPTKITESDVRHIAHLSRLNPSDDEVKLFTDQLSAILEYVDQLNEVDTANVPPTAHAAAVFNVFREDVPGECLTPDEALANAPARDGSFFTVPKVLEQDSA